MSAAAPGKSTSFRPTPTGYRPLARVATFIQARGPRLYVPELDRLLVAARAGLLGSDARDPRFPTLPLTRSGGYRMTVGNEWWRPMPQGASSDAIRILAARGVRAFGDGFVALLLPIWLVELGLQRIRHRRDRHQHLDRAPLSLTLWVGMIANRYSRRRLLLAAALLMTATGVGFTLTRRHFWPLLVIAFVGTMNPTSGDASIFASARADRVDPDRSKPRRRTALFARYSVIGSVAGALGVLAAAGPDLAVNWTEMHPHRRNAGRCSASTR